MAESLQNLSSEQLLAFLEHISFLKILGFHATYWYFCGFLLPCTLHSDTLAKLSYCVGDWRWRSFKVAILHYATSLQNVSV